MKQFSDQALAKSMLETRDRGFTFGLFARRNAWRYLLLFCGYYGLLLIGLGSLEDWVAFWLMLGVLAGYLLRDIAWFQSIGKTWPFSLRVTDWEKIQRIADETPAS